MVETSQEYLSPEPQEEQPLTIETATYQALLEFAESFQKAGKKISFHQSQGISELLLDEGIRVIHYQEKIPGKMVYDHLIFLGPEIKDQSILIKKNTQSYPYRIMMPAVPYQFNPSEVKSYLFIIQDFYHLVKTDANISKFDSSATSNSDDLDIEITVEEDGYYDDQSNHVSDSDLEDIPVVEDISDLEKLIK